MYNVPFTLSRVMLWSAFNGLQTFVEDLSGGGFGGPGGVFGGPEGGFSDNRSSVKPLLLVKLILFRTLQITKQIKHIQVLRFHTLPGSYIQSL